MDEPPSPGEPNPLTSKQPDPPLPKVESRRWIPSLIWLVPIAAALIGVSLLIETWKNAGPRVTISFQTAEGLEVGKTLVKYRNVTIGRVSGIALSADRGRVMVTADLTRSAEDLVTSNTRFWVVRPRIGVGWASGLDTLLSGAFIGLETGDSKTPARDFVGLESPPPLSHGLKGKLITLHADDLGSVNLGTPVYFRRFEVGQVIDRQLDADGTGARAVVFIDAPNDRFVTQATRFWNASGLNLALGADGLKLKTESLASVVAGGIAFDTAPSVQNPTPVSAGAQFTLFRDEGAAMAPPEGKPDYVRMRFTQSLRGLSIGAPVEFVGVNIGSVFSIDLDYEPKTNSFPVIVTAQIYPRRMGRAYEALSQQGTTESEEKMARLVGQLVARGLRAQPRSGNLLTGQLYIALDFIPGARPVTFAVDAKPLEIPTAPGSLDQLQLKLASIVNKVDSLPLSGIAHHTDEDLTALHGALEQLQHDLLPAAQSTLSDAHGTLGEVNAALAEDAPWREDVNQTLGETHRTLRSIRALTDYLNRHPEALIRGRRSPEPGTPENTSVGDSAR